MEKNKLARSLLYVIVLGGSQTSLAATCDYKLLSEWSSGFAAEVTITNDSAEAIEGWSVSWSYSDGSTIPQIWNAALAGQAPYVASNLAHNGSIPPNRSTTFGFNGSKANAGSGAEIPQLGGICGPQAPTNQAPVAVLSANPTQGNIPLDVTFDANSSSDADGDNLSYRWDFGDGDISTDATATRTFDQEGSYSVSLTVNDGQVDSEQVFTTIVATDQTDEVGPQSYVLDSENSSLHYVTTKQTHIIETNEFTDMYGSISENGEANLTINLNSVDTGIDLRNQRVRDFLFEVVNFGEAVVDLTIDLSSLSSQAIGTTRTESVAATLNLHGVSAAIDADVTVTKLSASKIMVQNVSPILVGAGDYDLTGGVDQLRTLANLNTISYTVPVNFTLFFNTPQSR